MVWSARQCRPPSAAVYIALAASYTPCATPQINAKLGQAENVVVSVRGHAEVKRKDWTSFVPLTFIQNGDLLRLDQSAAVQIVCSDLRMLNVNAGLSGNPCAPSQEILRSTNGSLLRPTRRAAL